MPRVSTIQTNFTAGEISPKVRGRVDVARYQNGAKSLTNMVVDIYGGAQRAPGTVFVSAATTNVTRSRLIPFTYNRDTAYHLEFSEGLIRVFRAGGGMILSGGLPYEIHTPFSASILQDLKFTQAGSFDSMFIAHPQHPVHMLRRRADDLWTLAPAAFSVYPFDELGAAPATTLTLSATAPGAGVVATLGAGYFLASDVGRTITYLGGSATITSVSSATVAVVTITDAFVSAALPSGQWLLEGSPQTTCTPSAQATVGQPVTLTLAAAGWRNPDDVGKFVKINGGLVQVTAFTSSTVMTGTCKADLSSNVAAPAGAWSLNAPVWSQLFGYPSAVAISQQRLVVGGTTKYPNGVWGSKTGLYLDFTLGEEDSDGYFYALDGESNGIQHLASVRGLIALTPGTEWTLVGGVEKPLTPTNVQAKDQTVYGSNSVRPVRVGDELIFVQRSGLKVRAMGYTAASDSFPSPNITTLSEHITESGIVEMAYQQEPSSTIWAVRADGKMAACTLDRDEGVIAWTPHETDGTYESISCVPNGAADDVLVVVRRIVNGQPQRYIERMDPNSYVHCGIFGTDPAGANVWGGLAHLEGKTVVALADGSPQGEFVVTGGQITLPRNAKSVQIGLRVTPKIELLTPEITTQTGTAQSAQMRAHKYSLLFLNTLGAMVNDKPVQFRQFGPGVLNKPPEPFSGWKGIGELGWNEGEMPAVISQPNPLPFHVLAVVRHWTTNE